MLLGHYSPLKLQNSCTRYNQVRFLPYKSLTSLDFVRYQNMKIKLKITNFIKRLKVTKTMVKQMLSKYKSIQIQSLKMPPSKWPLNVFNNLVKMNLKPYSINREKRFLQTYRQINGVVFRKNKFIEFPETRIIIQRTYSEGKGEDQEPGRHCYDQTLEKAMNHQILKEFNAGYAYLSMATYFGRTEIALPGAHGFFMRMHEEEHGHALKLVSYQLMRGANVKLRPVVIPECQEWESIQKALEVSIEMEKLVKESLLAVYKLAEEKNDITTMHLMEDEFINEQDRSIWEMARLLKRIKCMGTSDTGEFLFDKELHKAFVKKAPKKAIGNDSSTSDLYL